MQDCGKFTDVELVQKSLDNVEYFACLYDRYEKKLLRYVLRISKFSLEESEEILQESFIKAWENLNGFDQEMKFSSWIYRIVHNTVISEWKKSKSKGKDAKQEVDFEIFQNLASSFDLEEELDKEINKKQLIETLNTLSPKYKEVLVLKFLEEKSYNEISDILKKPSGTIATLINRAKQQFITISNKNNSILD